MVQRSSWIARKRRHAGDRFCPETAPWRASAMATFRRRRSASGDDELGRGAGESGPALHMQLVDSARVSAGPASGDLRVPDRLRDACFHDRGFQRPHARFATPTPTGSGATARALPPRSKRVWPGLGTTAFVLVPAWAALSQGDQAQLRGGAVLAAAGQADARGSKRRALPLRRPRGSLSQTAPFRVER